jgi:hypothetical protein
MGKGPDSNPRNTYHLLPSARTSNNGLRVSLIYLPNSSANLFLLVVVRIVSVTTADDDRPKKFVMPKLSM